MRTEPPVSRIQWPDARRIISSRYPPVDVFEDIADPRDWELLAVAEARTNPRINESIGRLDIVPPERRVSGSGASYLMAPFVHVSPDWAGRFHDGTFGAYYAARSFETSVAETAYHKGVFLKSTAEAPGWFAQMRELVGAVDNEFHDIRGEAGFEDCLDPDRYGPPQELARSLRAAGSNGVVYPSVRDTGGECVSAFWPNVIGLPVQGRHLGYHFDGDRVDLVRDEGSGKVWRVNQSGMGAMRGVQICKSSLHCSARQFHKRFWLERLTTSGVAEGTDQDTIFENSFHEWLQGFDLSYTEIASHSHYQIGMGISWVGTNIA